MHRTVDPAILYFGTPVVLVSTENEDGSANLAPMSSYTDRIDPEAWRPLIVNFCQFFGLGPKLHPSRLAEIPESAYRPTPQASPLTPVAVS